MKREPELFMNKWNNMHMGFPEGKEMEKGAENLFEKQWQTLSQI